MSTFVCVLVGLSVCPRACEPHARSVPNFLCMLPMAVARSSSGRVTKSQGEGAILAVFLPIDNPLCRLCSLSSGKGVMGVHSAGEVWYLRLPCCRLDDVLRCLYFGCMSSAFILVSDIAIFVLKRDVKLQLT